MRAPVVLALASFFALSTLPAAVAAQTGAKAPRAAKKAKASPRRPVERAATPSVERAAPTPIREPLTDRSTGSAY